MAEEGRQLYLVRHAPAGARGPQWPDDDVRPLTRRGIRRFTEVVAGMRQMGVRIDVVLTSPLVRARQTAAILAEGLDVRPEVVTCAALAPGVTPRVSLEVVGRMTTPRRFALVGHEPGLGRLVASLIGGRRPIAFRKGGACRVDVSLWGERPAGTLVWFLPPRLLRTLGKT